MRLPQVLHATGSSRIGIATIVKCLACEKTAAEARVAVVWGNMKCRRDGKPPWTTTQQSMPSRALSRVRIAWRAPPVIRY
ncbi:unnamed protein product, partial [Ectocarpus sp. 8 AP-2014]